jgi:hypothetical protein
MLQANVETVHAVMCAYKVIFKQVNLDLPCICDYPIF